MCITRSEKLTDENLAAMEENYLATVPPLAYDFHKILPPEISMKQGRKTCSGIVQNIQLRNKERIN